jgi:hypothetical protein
MFSLILIRFVYISLCSSSYTRSLVQNKLIFYGYHELDVPILSDWRLTLKINLSDMR